MDAKEVRERLDGWIDALLTYGPALWNMDDDNALAFIREALEERDVREKEPIIRPEWADTATGAHVWEQDRADYLVASFIKFMSKQEPTTPLKDQRCGNCLYWGDPQKPPNESRPCRCHPSYCYRDRSEWCGEWKEKERGPD